MYFEPINIAPAPKSATQQVPPDPPLEKCSEPLRKILSRRSRAKSSRSTIIPDSASVISGYDGISNPDEVQSSITTSESNNSRSQARSRSQKSAGSSIKTSKSAQSSRTRSTLRQMAILDKSSVFQRENDNIQEDLGWIVGQESTGSLCIIPSKNGRSDPRLKWDRERICRGSMVKKVLSAKSANNQRLNVSGGKYRDSMNRAGTSITPSGGDIQGRPIKGEERLPPLEQLRNTLRYMDYADNYGDKGMLQHVIPTLNQMNLNASPRVTSKRHTSPVGRYPGVKYSQAVK